MTTRAAVYCRISDDRAGLALGVQRQREDCQNLAEAKGWTVAMTFTDNDVSAYSGKTRPQYLALLDAIAARTVDVVLAWHPDRLHRSLTELEHFIGVVEATGVHVETVQAGQWDLSTPSGRFLVRSLGGVARYESEHKSERVRRALEQNAAAGRAHGRRPYGWRRTYDGAGTAHEVIEPGEAAVVIEVAERLVAGDSLRAITADLNQRGVPSPTGKTWAKGMVRHVVLRHRNAGLRIHRGEVLGEGAWAPILDQGLFEQTLAVLADPQRRTAVSSAAAHLLSGIANCGVCGAKLRASRNRGLDSYRCSATSCVSRNRRDVDALVTGVVLGRLARHDAAQLFRPDTCGERRAATDEARGLRARLDTAADDYADGKIDARQLERISMRLRPRIDAADRRARVLDDSPLLEGLLANDRVADVWETLPLTRRRALVDLLLRVTVLRTQQGAREFDPTSVRVEWRTSA